MRRPLAAALLLALLPVPGRGGDKVGPESCRACHPGAYEAWRASPHARSVQALPERSRGDAACLSCHAPDAAAGIDGVSCEACHGPGRLYSAAYVMRDAELARVLGLADPGERTCRACHTDTTPSLLPFDYARKLRLIAHGEGEPAAAPAPRPAAPPGEGR